VVTSDGREVHGRWNVAGCRMGVKDQKKA